jgi:hypothetical protein
MHIKMTLKVYLTLVRMAIIKKKKITNAGEDMRAKITLIHCWWEC